MTKSEIIAKLNDKNIIVVETSTNEDIDQAIIGLTKTIEDVEPLVNECRVVFPELKDPDEIKVIETLIWAYQDTQNRFRQSIDLLNQLKSAN